MSALQVTIGWEGLRFNISDWIWIYAYVCGYVCIYKLCVCVCVCVCLSVADTQREDKCTSDKGKNDVLRGNILLYLMMVVWSSSGFLLL